MFSLLLNVDSVATLISLLHDFWFEWMEIVFAAAIVCVYI